MGLYVLKALFLTQCLIFALTEEYQILNPKKQRIISVQEILCEIQLARLLQLSLTIVVKVADNNYFHAFLQALLLKMQNTLRSITMCCFSSV